MFPQNSITFLGRTSGLGADKLVRRQNIVIIAFHYNKTVSLSHKTNKVHLKRYNVSCKWLRFKASLLLAECDKGISDQRVTHDGFETYAAFISFP